MKPVLTMAAFAAAFTLISPAHGKTTDCPDPATARADVEQSIRDFFGALRTKDDAPFKRVLVHEDGRRKADFLHSQRAE